MDNLTESEKNRKQLITQIRRFLQEGNPDILCRSSRKDGILHQYRDYIMNSLKNGLTQSEIIRQLRDKYEYTKSRTLAHRYMEDLIKQYELKVNRYKSSAQTTQMKNNTGAMGRCHNYITRKGVFRYLWMNTAITKAHHKYIWNKYPILWRLEGYRSN